MILVIILKIRFTVQDDAQFYISLFYIDLFSTLQITFIEIGKSHFTAFQMMILISDVDDKIELKST